MSVFCPAAALNERMQAAHKEQVDRLMARAHHHRKNMNDDKFTVEHMVLALAENQR